jgi:hypothetical protein
MTASKTGFISCFISNDLRVTQVRPSRMRDTALRQQTFRFLRRTIPVKLTDWPDHTHETAPLIAHLRNITDLDQLAGRAPAKVASSPQRGAGEWSTPSSRQGRRVCAVMFQYDRLADALISRASSSATFGSAQAAGAPGPCTVISIRRFFAMFAGVSFGATGCVSPNPLAEMMFGLTPCEIR